MSTVHSASGSSADRLIFISFSSKDVIEAERIRDAIERRGFACWMSSRDIHPGENFQEAIMRALRRAGAVVLVFSSNANASNEIKKEVALASTYKIPLIPARLENILPTDALAYEFITRQWIDLFPDRDASIRRLCMHLEALDRNESEGAADGPGFAAPLSLAEIPNNLPSHDSAFIGREEEKARLIELLGKHRLITLLGSGGLGKTRLSLEVAGEVMRKYPDGVWLAELAPLSEPRLVAETVAGILSLEVPSSRTATDVVVAFLRDKKLLLILDNCEHLIAAAASFAQALVHGCPHITLIASSREALQITDEHGFRMPTLAAPPADAGNITAADAMLFPAVVLFVARARAALGGFELSDADAPAVSAICRRLDGIALAIELAAPRLRMLRPAQLLEKLDERFRILTGGRRTALPRQQTLRALIDWSFNLLTDGEKALMRRLAVFPGGWTMDAADAVGTGDPIEDWEIFDLMASLIDKSLVHTAHTETETRYNLLESTRAYALEKLKEAGEANWPGRMAAYFAGLMKEADWQYETTPTPIWRGRYGPEIDNLRASLDWAFAPGGDRDAGLRLVAYSGWLWTELDLSAENRRRVEVAFPNIEPDTDPAVAARIHYKLAAGTGTGATGGGAVVAVELARVSGDPLTLGRALIEWSFNLMRSDLARARVALQEAVEVAKTIGRTKILGTVLNGLGMIDHYDGNRASARRYYEEALAVGRALGDSRGMNGVLLNSAELSFVEGTADRAIDEARQGLQIAERHHLRESQALFGANLAGYLALSGDHAAAATFALAAARQARDLDYDLVSAWALQHLAAVAAHEAQFEIAAKLQGFVDRVYQNHGAARELTEQLTCDSARMALAETPDPEAAARWLEAGGRLSPDEAIELATVVATLPFFGRDERQGQIARS